MVEEKIPRRDLLQNVQGSSQLSTSYTVGMYHSPTWDQNCRDKHRFRIASRIHWWQTVHFKGNQSNIQIVIKHNQIFLYPLFWYMLKSSDENKLQFAIKPIPRTNRTNRTNRNTPLLLICKTCSRTSFSLYWCTPAVSGCTQPAGILVSILSWDSVFLHQLPEERQTLFFILCSGEKPIEEKDMADSDTLKVRNFLEECAIVRWVAMARCYRCFSCCLMLIIVVLFICCAFKVCLTIFSPSVFLKKSCLNVFRG